ncbi:hypothetical protein BGX38DRAFT_1169577 [Terfezia claveryi]|nr:hypothetical protein BGX38DRAFT_1169577 [Terfezia claveryi]
MFIKYAKKLGIDPTFHTCLICSTFFPSNNQLHKHLRKDHMDQPAKKHRMETIEVISREEMGEVDQEKTKEIE